MQLGRTHRAQMRFPIHFTAPDRSKTYIGETIDISSNGFSVQVTTDDPLPMIILAGILPTHIAGDAILCKARVVWQGGLAGGTKRASYKITSIAKKSQDRLDEIIQDSVQGLIADLQDLPLFANSERGQLEMLLHLARSRELPADSTLYDSSTQQGTGVMIILDGEIKPVGQPGPVFGPGCVLGRWDESQPQPEPESARTRVPTRFLHLPASLTRETDQEVPAIAAQLKGALGQAVSDSVDELRRRPRRKLRPNVLKELQEIPTLPAVFNAVMDCMEDPEATPRDLAQVIRKDQSLTAKILKTVNSALYGFTRRISSVDESVVILGMTQTANLAITATLLNTLVDARSPERRAEAFWQHSLGSAYIAQALGECLASRGASVKRKAAVAARQAADREASGTPAQPEAKDGDTLVGIPPEQLFTHAIVHDIGMVALYVSFPDHFATVQEAMGRYGTFHRAEMDLLEVDHCQLGFRIARAWRLPEPMPTVIAEHHLPQIWAEQIEDEQRLTPLLREDRLVTLVALADLMTRACGIGSEQDTRAPAIPDALIRALDLERDDIDQIMEQGEMIKQKAELFFRGVTT